MTATPAAMMLAARRAACRIGSRIHGMLPAVVASIGNHAWRPRARPPRSPEPFGRPGRIGGRVPHGVTAALLPLARCHHGRAAGSLAAVRSPCGRATSRRHAGGSCAARGSEPPTSIEYDSIRLVVRHRATMFG